MKHAIAKPIVTSKNLIVAVPMKRRVAASVLAPRVEQAIAFDREPGPHDVSKLLQLATVSYTVQ